MIITKLVGGNGNQMSQYAAADITKLDGKNVKIDGLKELPHEK